MSKFNGWGKPEQNFVMMPKALIDALPIINSESELKVILYVLRHTWGYNEYEEGKLLTIDEFCNGRKRRDKTRVDDGVGLSENAVKLGIKKAVEHGFLEIEEDNRDKARQKRFYKLSSGDSNLRGSESDPQNVTLRVSDSDPRTERNTLEKKEKDIVAMQSQPLPFFDDEENIFSVEQKQEQQPIVSEAVAVTPPPMPPAPPTAAPAKKQRKPSAKKNDKAAYEAQAAEFEKLPGYNDLKNAIFFCVHRHHNQDAAIGYGIKIEIGKLAKNLITMGYTIEDLRRWYAEIWLKEWFNRSGTVQTASIGQIRSGVARVKQPKNAMPDFMMTTPASEVKADVEKEEPEFLGRMDLPQVGFYSGQPIAAR